MLFTVLFFLIHYIVYIIIKKYFPILRFRYVLFCAATVFTTLLIAFNPKVSINAALSGLTLFKNSVLPSLFPFFICTYLIVHLNIANFIGKFFSPIMKPVFNVPGNGAIAFVMGILSGYPVGAKMAGDLYSNNECTKVEAERISAFCNNSGPLFILGAVSVTILNSPQSGLILYFSHIISALITGIIFRFYKRNDNMDMDYLGKQKKNIYTNMNIYKVFSDSVVNSVNLILIIGGYIVFFTVLINILKDINLLIYISELIRTIFPFLNEKIILCLMYGFFEITNGIKALSLIQIDLNSKLIFTSLIIGWAGLSVHCQAASLLVKNNLSLRPYVIGKSIQSIFATVITFLFLKTNTLSNESVKAMNYIYSSQGYTNNILSTMNLIGNILIIVIIIYILYIKNKRIIKSVIKK